MYSGQPVPRLANVNGELWVEIADALAAGVPLAVIDGEEQREYGGKRRIRMRAMLDYLEKDGSLEGTLEGTPVPLPQFFQDAGENYGRDQMR